MDMRAKAIEIRDIHRLISAAGSIAELRTWPCFPLAVGVLFPILLGLSTAALAMSGNSALVAINALMLKRTKLTGIRRQHATAAPDLFTIVRATS